MLDKGWTDTEHWWGTVLKKTVGAFTGEVKPNPITNKYHWIIKELGDVVDDGIEEHYVQAVAEIDRRLELQLIRGAINAS